MIPKNKALIVAVIILVLGVLTFAILKKEAQAPTRQSQQSTPAATPKPASASSSLTGHDDVLKNALNLYLEKKREGTDMANGPCLGKIADDWVLDIAHNPRQPIDNKHQNQCQDFIEGKAHHFIELDPDGKLIRSN